MDQHGLSDQPLGAARYVLRAVLDVLAGVDDRPGPRLPDRQREHRLRHAGDRPPRRAFSVAMSGQTRTSRPARLRIRAKRRGQYIHDFRAAGGLAPRQGHRPPRRRRLRAGAQGTRSEYLQLVAEASWCPAVFKRGPEERADWEILLEIAERLGGGASGIGVIDKTIRLARKLGLRWTPKASVDFFLRLGPHGDRYLPWSSGLNLKRLTSSMHGVDLGPLEPGVSRRVLHRDRRIRLAAEPILSALAESEKNGMASDNGLLLIGRRDLRSSNSWMHNIEALVSGRERCVLLVHPRDAERAGVRDGETAVLESRVYRGPVPVHVTDDMMQGVVSLPHGWGHRDVRRWQKVAGVRAGVSMNDWTDDNDVEAVVGQSILNGIPVQLKPTVSAIAGE